ncbi:hypothetical protein [Streptomyces sp. MMG1121]|uniref:hypothetical protein n=1 Tax=Streptomyces sp. MMG1121 TaxID=1415544 RepID=UPI0006AFEAF0|nr:hypothetical protein [Streptomyces sp. MMG1121]
MRRTLRALSVAFAAGAALVLAGPATSAAPATGPANCETVAGAVPGAVPGPVQLPPDGKPCRDIGGSSGDSGGTRCRTGEESCRDSTGCRGGGSCSGVDGDHSALSDGRTGLSGQGDHSGHSDGRTGQSGHSDGHTGQSGRSNDHSDHSGRGDQGDHGDHDDHSCTESRDPQHDGQSHDGQSHGSQSHDGDDCSPATVQHGVEAGQGGSLTDSVPALAAGGVLIATACAGAGYRLHGHRRTGV